MENQAIDTAGGMHNSDSSPVLTNVMFIANESNNLGGGMMNHYSSPSLTNVLFAADNATGDAAGASINSYHSAPTLTNVTFSGNHAGSDGGGMQNRESNPIVVNGILWNNTPNQIADDSCRFPPYRIATLKATGPAQATLTSIPLFVDAANGDLRLQPTSPAIDLGDNSAIPAGVTTDLDGNPRIVDGVVDLGAYEHQ